MHTLSVIVSLFGITLVTALPAEVPAHQVHHAAGQGVFSHSFSRICDHLEVMASLNELVYEEAFKFMVETWIEDGILRSDFEPIFNAFLKNLEKTVTKLTGEAKEKLEEFKKLYLSLKEEVISDLQDLRSNLIKRLHEARGLGEEKYEAVRQKAAQDLKQKKIECREKVLQLQQKITKFLRELQEP